MLSKNFFLRKTLFSVKAVLRIHDILVWIRIRIWIRGSMPLNSGSWWGCGSGSCYFRQSFSAYYFLKVHLHHFSKIKSRKKSQSSKYQGFSYSFCLVIEGSGAGSGSIPLNNGTGSTRPKKTDPTDPDSDPDPQNCVKRVPNYWRSTLPKCCANGSAERDPEGLQAFPRGGPAPVSCSFS